MKLLLRRFAKSTRGIFLRTNIARNMSTASQPSRSTSEELFEYTSGRWIYNEELRRTERSCPFDIDGLTQVLAKTSNRPVSTLLSLAKLSEGGFNRILEATFDDGHQIIARLPYPMVTPKRYTIASEVATLKLLHSRGIPVPKVLGYDTTVHNPVGVEYILLEKISGTSLGDRWFEMSNRSRKRIIEQIINIEKRIFQIHFPASGSLYHRQDLTDGERYSHVTGASSSLDEVVVGPIAQHEWYYKERAELKVDRGPWSNFHDCFTAGAKKELKWCEIYGKPRLHVERYLRELHSFQKMDPAQYQELLKLFLKLAPSLNVEARHPLSRPVLRHPDLSPNNIMVSEDDQILGIIDWQHAVVLPLCLVAGIPKYFQNWGDPVSEKLSKPDTKLPENFNELDPQQQASVKETLQKRLTHFLYAAGTMIDIPDHFSAITQYNAMLRNRLYSLASMPWEGDSVSLKRTLIEVVQNWPLTLEQSGSLETPPHVTQCPIEFSPEETQECIQQYDTQEEELQELISMRDHLDIDPQGWVPDDDHWEKSREMASDIKQAMLEHAAKTELTRTAILDHFPFDDHEE
ncbi:hypothetical protein FH972_023809 [Carpinus fangiana]|uniref:Aminoglycoside phosphotransferase domain-containing protein n=1 Tax=Carpinus fangiana TaxID=176857 RepID=A0A5N6KWN2_9ROSI|nr:hypothetical protein FH972_023809 [Carpinus fangiana]